MNSVENGLVEILNTGYIVCLVLTIIFFLLTILLFFVFDIRKIYMIRSGKAAKRDIKKLEEKNFKTGSLAKNNLQNSMYGESGEFEESEDLGKTEKIDRNTDRNTDNATTVLVQEETTVLAMGETTVLSSKISDNVSRNWKFNIIVREILIHTEETI